MARRWASGWTIPGVGSLRAVVVALSFVAAAGCHLSRQDGEPAPMRDINAVLNDHDGALMAIPGVTGVCVGLARDGRTVCLRVMAVKATAALRRQVPRQLEGYVVVVEETGVIRPLNAR